MLERLLGAPVVAERTVAGGYTNARRQIVTPADGRSAFVKTAVDDQTRGWLETEHPEVPVAPGLRAIQRAQPEVALPWAARALGLSRPRPR